MRFPIGNACINVFIFCGNYITDKIVTLSMLNVILNLTHSTINRQVQIYKGGLKMADIQSVLISLWGFDDTFCTYSGIF